MRAWVLALAWLVACQSAPRPMPAPDPCPIAKPAETSTAALSGVSKLDLHRRALRARYLAQEFADLEQQRRGERDIARSELREERAARAALEHRPTWWTLLAVGSGGLVVGAIIGILSGLTSR